MGWLKKLWHGLKKSNQTKTKPKQKNTTLEIGERSIFPWERTYPFLLLATRVSDWLLWSNQELHWVEARLPHQLVLVTSCFQMAWRQDLHYVYWPLSDFQPIHSHLCVSFSDMLSVESDIFTRVLQNNEIEHGNESAPPWCQASLWIPKSFSFSDWDLEVPWMWSNGDQYTHRHLLPFKCSLFKMSLSLKMWINIVKAHRMCEPWKCHLTILYATYICFSLFKFSFFLWLCLSQSCQPIEGS